MEIDYRSVGVSGISIERMLRRVDELVQLAKQGFDYAVPELRVFLSTGQQFSGFMVAYDPSETLVLHSLQRGGVTNTVYIESSRIAGIELMNIDSYPQLLDLQSELHFSKSVSRIQLQRELERFQSGIQQKTGAEINYLIDEQLEPGQVPAVFNMAQVVKNAIEKTAVDEMGRQAVCSGIATVVIGNQERAEIQLVDGVLTYQAPYQHREKQLSVAEMVNRLAELL